MAVTPAASIAVFVSTVVVLPIVLGHVLRLLIAVCIDLIIVYALQAWRLLVHGRLQNLLLLSRANRLVLELLQQVEVRRLTASGGCWLVIFRGLLRKETLNRVILLDSCLAGCLARATRLTTAITLCGGQDEAGSGPHSRQLLVQVLTLALLDVLKWLVRYSGLILLLLLGGAMVPVLDLGVLRVARVAAAQLLVALASVLVDLLVERHEEHEAAADAPGGPAQDVASQLLRDHLANVKAEANAASVHALRAVQVAEQREQSGLVLDLDAGARVLHDDLDHAVLSRVLLDELAEDGLVAVRQVLHVLHVRGLDLDGATALSEFERVRQQVEQHLLDALLVRADHEAPAVASTRRHVARGLRHERRADGSYLRAVLGGHRHGRLEVRELHSHIDVHVFSLELKHVHDLLNAVLHVERLRQLAELAGSELREVQDVVDKEIKEAFATRLDAHRLHVLLENPSQLPPEALERRDFLIVQELFDLLVEAALLQVLAPDRVRRVTHLVRHRGIDELQQLLLALGHIVHDLRRDVDNLEKVVAPRARIVTATLDLHVLVERLWRPLRHVVATAPLRRA